MPIEKLNWEERFDENFPYKIQGAPKHTKLLFINKEIKEFIKNLLLEREKELYRLMENKKISEEHELYNIKYYGFNKGIIHCQSLLDIDEK